MMRPARPWENLEDSVAILMTSYSPNSVDARALRLRTADRLAELRHIEASPDRSPRSRARAQALWQANNVARGLLAPVRKLPAEILGEIFTFAIPQWSVEGMRETPPYAYEAGLYPNEVRRTLRQVCRQWNLVALGTPSVWSSLTIDEDLDLPDFKLGILHSRACHLDIFMEGGSYEESYYSESNGDIEEDDYRTLDNSDRANSLLELLRPEIHRIRNLVYTYLADEYVCRLFPEGQTAIAPSLKVFLAMAAVDPEDFEGERHSGLGSIHSPNVESITLNDNPKVLANFTVDSLRNLHRLVIFCPKHFAPTARYYLEFLPQCPSLTELEISFISSIWAEDDDVYTSGYTGGKIQLLSLSSLVITESDDFEIGAFLSHLRLPSLRYLYLHNHHSVESRVIQRRSHIEPGLRELQPEIAGSFQHLEFHSFVFLEDLSLPLLDNLVTLDFSQCYVSDKILASITPASTSGSWPCPFLSDITFTQVMFCLPGNGLVSLLHNRTCDDNAEDPPAQRTFIRIDQCKIMDHSGFNSYEVRMLAGSRRDILLINPVDRRHPLYLDEDAQVE